MAAGPRDGSFAADLGGRIQSGISPEPTRSSATRTAMLSPTPRASLTDREGRPYFLWDLDLSLDGFQERLGSPDPEVRDFYLAKLLRQAKPDDALQFVTLAEIAASWTRVEPRLGSAMVG